jgi:hypothetical protein
MTGGAEGRRNELQIMWTGSDSGDEHHPYAPASQWSWIKAAVSSKPNLYVNDM